MTLPRDYRWRWNGNREAYLQDPDGTQRAKLRLESDGTSWAWYVYDPNTGQRVPGVRVPAPLKKEAQAIAVGFADGKPMPKV